MDSAYDFFVVGSDQVWNAHSNDIKSNLNNFLASFAPPEKRVAYAASFGTSDIAPGYEVFFRKELPKFKAIAVREKEGVRLVEQCGAKAVVTLDPTMMLTAERWNKLAKKPRFISSEPYVVTYFLGGRNEKLRKHIEKVANGAKIVHLDAEFAPQETIENPEAFATSPDEFLWLIAHAECVLTDSFHASVFSILYHKPFQVFERLMNGKSGGMESRIDTLLGTFHLEHCKGDISNPDGYPSSSSWADVDAILAVERKKSLDYLKNALRKE